MLHLIHLLFSVCSSFDYCALNRMLPAHTHCEKVLSLDYFPRMILEIEQVNDLKKNYRAPQKTISSTEESLALP